MEDQAAHIIRTFWNAFRDNFKTSTLVWIPHSIILLGLSYNIYLFQFLLDESGYQKAVILLAVLLVVMVGAGVYLYMLIARFENTAIDHVKNALALF